MAAPEPLLEFRTFLEEHPRRVALEQTYGLRDGAVWVKTEKDVYVILITCSAYP